VVPVASVGMTDRKNDQERYEAVTTWFVSPKSLRAMKNASSKDSGATPSKPSSQTRKRASDSHAARFR